ncbi:MAG: hypothetical protein IJK99_09360 [Bacteroidales bacterium]|nr:hypothetical protein [Bacteroidales bacterium]
MKNAILETIGDGLGYLAGVMFCALVWAEKRVFWATGYKGRALAAAWERSGRRLQKALNREHGTRIEYGYITK